MFPLPGRETKDINRIFRERQDRKIKLIQEEKKRKRQELLSLCLDVKKEEPKGPHQNDTYILSQHAKKQK